MELEDGATTMYLYPESSMFRGGLFVEIFAFDLLVRCWAIPDAVVGLGGAAFASLMTCLFADPWTLGSMDWCTFPL
jgi:hypothetical protein